MPKLEGPDVNIEISLKEYGIAWEIGETETRFYYGTGHNGEEFTHFDWAGLENDIDVKKECDWVNFAEVMRFVGWSLEEWEKLPLTEKIQDLNSYYGVMNVFGESYTEPMTYEEIIEGK